MIYSDSQSKAALEPERVDPANGWTLQQAFERVTDPDLLDAWHAAAAEYQKVKTPIPAGMGSFLQSSPEKIRRCRQAALDAWHEAKKNFRRVLSESNLCETGSRDGRSVSPTPIYQLGWETLAFIDFDRSVVRERGPSKTRIYNVRIFPLIHSAESVEKLSGCSFVEAFHMCVLNDPEVIAASKRIKNVESYSSVFRAGQFPGPTIDFRWPLEIAVDSLAYSFVRPVMYFIDDPLPQASEAIQHVSEIVVDRWSRLRRRLIDGELFVQGTFARTGLVQTIDPLQWTRANISVDVQNGDFFGQENDKPVALWTGLVLRAGRADQRAFDVLASGNVTRMHYANLMFHGKPTDYNRTRSNTVKHRRRSRVAEQVARAIEARGIADLPGLRSWKEVATEIAPFMAKQPKTENEWQALIKALQRHSHRSHNHD